MSLYDARAAALPALAGSVDDTARGQVDWICHDLVGTQRILDAGCGAGRHSVLLAERGHEVTGVDAAAVPLAMARSLASQHGVDLPLVEADLRDSPSGPFDRIILLDVTLGAFEDHEAAEILSAMRARLAPRGRVLVELYHLPWWRKHLGPRELSPSDAHPTRLVRRTYREELGYLIDDVQLVDGQQVETLPTQRLRAWSLEEAVSLVARSGLKPVDLWGPRGWSYAGTPGPPGPDSPMFWVVAER